MPFPLWTAREAGKKGCFPVLIVSSGYSNDPVIANYQRYGFSGAVIKPFSFQSLAGEVRRLTGKRR